LLREVTGVIRETSGDEPAQYIPARMLNEFTYCPRLFYLEHVEGLFAHNVDTIEGSARHVRVDRKETELPSAQEATEREKIHARSVTLASDRYGVIAKIDLVEAQGDLATPVDYKRGSPKKLDDGSLGAWDPERVQLCVQAMVLRENGYRCQEGVLFFWETRQRVRIAIDDELVRLTEQTIASARQTVESGQLPPPLVDSPKCPRCSLVGICLPDETTRCTQMAEADGQRLIQPLLFDIGPQWGVAASIQAECDDGRPLRQLVTPRDERRPLYLNSQGYFVGKAGEVLQIKDKGKLVQEVRLHDVSQVNVMGAVQISAQAVQALLQAEIPLLYFSMGGWFFGMTQAVGLKNIMWRREQFRLADQAAFCLRLARELISGKIRNQRTLLMRNHVEPPSDALRFLKAMIWEAERAETLPALLGIEGMAARVYFQNFSGMIKVNASHGEASGSADPQPCSIDAAGLGFDFDKRNRRPPRDPINALLSLGYSLLAKDLTVVCAAVGLDPYLAYYHQPRFGRPALALDLMEPFRALIVDSSVLSAVNQRMVTRRHFLSAGDAVTLTVDGRKAFFQVYEQRMDQLVTHPLFGYRVSYRRVLEIQTRLLARVLIGEIGSYPVFVTR
jgi:CRISPR-associated protein Cas1